MRVLVCGGRDYQDRNRVYDELDAIHAQTPISAIIEGGAAGADHFACLWSAKRNLDAHHRFSADWAINGRAAGPIRNARMIAEGKPDLVLAFPGGRGTADMIRKAEAAGIPVVRPRPLPLRRGEGLMTTPTHDLIAINERGVYAICYDDGSPEAGEFVAEGRRRGDRVERVPVREACARHLEYLRALSAFRGVFPLPSIGL